MELAQWMPELSTHSAADKLTCMAEGQTVGSSKTWSPFRTLLKDLHDLDQGQDATTVMTLKWLTANLRWRVSVLRSRNRNQTMFLYAYLCGHFTHRGSKWVKGFQFFERCLDMSVNVR